MNNRYIFRGKRKDNGKWVEGFYSCDIWGDETEYILYDEQEYEVIPETVGRCTELPDKNGKPIFEGDVVKIVDFQSGVITQECGAFGISVVPSIDWDYLDSEIAEITGCDNMPYFCRNDNFISLYELMWNYNQEEFCGVVEVIGNIHDDKYLLEVER